MPQVPYNPVPDVTPTDSSPGPMKIDAPGAAFGTTIATAVQSVGGDLNKAGDELFARAMAIQDLQNRADADKANQDFDEQAAPIHADFNAKQGIDRVNAAPQYRTDIHTLRDQIGEKLNPMARKLYDSQSRRQSASMIFSSAVVTAQAFKDYQIKTSDGNVNLLIKKTAEDWKNDKAYDDAVEQAKREAHVQAQVGGVAGTSWEQAKAQEYISKLTRERLDRANQESPAAAGELYEKLKGNMVDADSKYSFNSIKGQQRSIETTNVAQEAFKTMYDETGKIIKSRQQAEDEVKLKISKLAPNDPIAQQRAVDTLRTLDQKYIQDNKVNDWQSAQQVRDYIRNHPEIKDEQQLRADPQMQLILNNLHYRGAGIDAPGYIRNLLKKEFEGVNEENFYNIKNIARRDPAKFMDMDFSGEQISRHQMDQLEELRKSMMGKPLDDPHLTRALTWMQQQRGAELEGLGLVHGPNFNADDRHQYEAAMWQAIDAWKASHDMKVPDAKAVTQEIGPAVLQKYTHTNFFGYRSQVPEYKADIDPEFIASRKANNPNATDEGIRRDWNAFVFRQLFGAPKGDRPKTDEGTGGPAWTPGFRSMVPQSK